MRLSSQNSAHRIFITGTAALILSFLAVTLSVSEGGATAHTTVSGSNEVVVAEDRVATTGSSTIAAAVSSVVRTGATAATATVLGGAAATGASAAALPDSNDADAALIMAGTLLALTGMAAFVLLRASAKERHQHHE